MTALELSRYIGKTGILSLPMYSETLLFNVRIMNAKTSYGCPRYLIMPVSGTGSQWVNADRVQLTADPKKGVSA